MSRDGTSLYTTYNNLSTFELNGVRKMLLFLQITLRDLVYNGQEIVKGSSFDVHPEWNT